VNWRNGQKELFDLHNDPYERDDLSSRMPRETTQLFRTLTDYLKKVNAESPPPPPQYQVSLLTSTPTIDGRLNEWPLQDRQRTMRLKATGGGPPSRAWLAMDDHALYVAVHNPVNNVSELKQLREPPTQFDRVLLAIQDDFAQPRGPVLTLLGLPNGEKRNINFAKAPKTTLDRLFAHSDYAARISNRDWSCEWRIPFSALGFTPDSTPKVRFNLIVKKTRPTASCIWQSTGGYMWELDQAGLLLFPK
jgi:hypothetical protein